MNQQQQDDFRAALSVLVAIHGDHIHMGLGTSDGLTAALLAMGAKKRTYVYAEDKTAIDDASIDIGGVAVSASGHSRPATEAELAKLPAGEASTTLDANGKREWEMWF